MDEVWAMLCEPFAEEALGWRIEGFSRDRKRALVARCATVEAVLERLDEVVGPQGWQDSYELLPSKERHAVKCRLTILGVSKEALGEGETLQAAFADALRQAAAKFGIGRVPAERRWVELDPESGQPSLGRGEEEAAAKPEAQVLIDRLMERLKAAGLGKQAAQIVLKYGGYGRHPEETRKLYGELRALLKGHVS
ncbi:DNA repair protein Rad52 [Meiothermus sp. QL-1]|uniref:DNA repair protein Rad52 n=1 Tax=Meiothermus sp. QL-1 TaxID=2058095 RepID=UPI000E0B2486|nr:DNA repair protein Rad52 [Meiothermus sp. QL-1]RDI96561.1 DNA repair protein Rad52 [Meiothermus sp. QL-1]